MLNCLFVGMGGFVGATARYLCGFIPIPQKSGFPFITLCIDFLGALLIGWISGISSKSGGMNPQLVLFLKTGVCGGFTTFSTFALESTTLIEKGKTGMALLYMGFSVIVCIAAVMAGQKIAVG